MAALRDYDIAVGDGEAPAFAVLCKLLGWLRVHVEEWKREALAQTGAGRALYVRLLSELEGISLRHSYEWIQVRVDPLIEDASQSIAARGLAMALDTLLDTDTEIRGYYDPTWVGGDLDRRPQVRPIREGDPVPLRVSPRGSLPFERRPDRTDRVLLAPEHFHGFRVFIDFSLASVELPFEAAVATGHPIVSRSDWLDRDPTNGEFVDPPTVVRRTLSMLKRAGERRASLFVLPEGSVTPELVEEIRGRWTTLPSERRPTVIVAGSAYLSSDGIRCNESSLLGLAGSSVGEEVLEGTPHRKFEPVPPSGDKKREELSHVNPKITIHVLSGGVKLVVLICRDALVPGAVRLVEDLGIDFVVIPAVTPHRPHELERLAGYLASNWRMTTVVANTRLNGGADAVVGRPPLNTGSYPRTDRLSIRHFRRGGHLVVLHGTGGS